MLNKSANCLVGLLEKFYDISEEERPVYIYGFELLLSTLSSMITIFSVSIIIGKPGYAMFFMLFFFSLRLFTGGYHAKTYLRCFITTNTLFIATILLTEFILFFHLKWIMPILVIISTAVIWIFAPIKNIHHPCSEESYIKNKKRAHLLSSLYSLIFIYIYLFTNFNDIAVNSAWHLITVAVMIVIEKIKIYKEVKSNEFHQFKNCWSCKKNSGTRSRSCIFRFFIWT